MGRFPDSKPIFGLEWLFPDELCFWEEAALPPGVLRACEEKLTDPTAA
jgi:hypothetical protein